MKRARRIISRDYYRHHYHTVVERHGAICTSQLAVAGSSSFQRINWWQCLSFNSIGAVVVVVVLFGFPSFKSRSENRCFCVLVVVVVVFFSKVIFTPNIIVRKEKHGKASNGRSVISMRFQVVILRRHFLSFFYYFLSLD